MERSEKIQIVFLIVMFIAILCLIYTTITIIRYSDMIKNPLSSNLDKFGIERCACYKPDGTAFMVTNKTSNYTQLDLFNQYGQKKDYSNITNFSLTFI